MRRGSCCPFGEELLTGRTDRCETLLRVALSYDWTEKRWRAIVLAHAGKMYLARDRYQLAEERLREAGQLVSLDGRTDIAVSIALALPSATGSASALT